ncbi:hypothetical protein ACWF5S_08560 [Peribacillus butanolivorans]
MPTHLFQAIPYQLPLILGWDLAAVKKIGEDVDSFQVGNTLCLKEEEVIQMNSSPSFELFLYKKKKVSKHT